MDLLFARECAPEQNWFISDGKVMCGITLLDRLVQSAQRLAATYEWSPTQAYEYAIEQEYEAIHSLKRRMAVKQLAAAIATEQAHGRARRRERDA